MLSFDEALDQVLRAVPRVANERLPVHSALGRVLAEPLVAREPMPAFDHSAMDGYAVRRADLRGEGPWRLPVRGESRTGRPSPTLAQGTTCRIFTGAALPDGADAVVMQEEVVVAEEQACIEARPAAWQHVRRRGDDLDVGAVALDAGARLSPGALGLCAALDRAHVVVARRPNVTILCTGDELRAAGDPPRPNSIPESNGVAIAAQVALAGGAARLSAFVPDDATATARAIREGLAATDLLITIGGVSVGDHDLVRPALEAAGVALEFYKVRIRPGKPLTYGTFGATRVLGLPGNPVSAQVTFALFGVPLLRAMQGDRRAAPRYVKVTLGSPVRQKPGRRGFYRARLEGDRATVHENQSSGAPTSMADADVLIVVPEDSPGFEAGARVDALLLGVP